MDLKIILRIEERFDQLLGQCRELGEENRRLRDVCHLLQEERQQFRDQLDRILVKLEGLEQGAP